MKELSNALDSVVDWYSLGIKLGMKVHELATIEKNYHGDNERCKLETLNHCLESGKLPTWKVVTDALQLMGKHEVALKIRAKYCSSSIESADTAGMYQFVCSKMRTNQLYTIGIAEGMLKYRKSKCETDLSVLVVFSRTTIT